MRIKVFESFKLERELAHLFGGRWEAGTLSTGQSSVGGQAVGAKHLFISRI